MVHQDLIFQIVAFWNLMEEEQCLAWTRDHVSAVVCRAPRLYLSDPSTLSGNAMGVVGKDVRSEFWLWGFTLQLHHFWPCDLGPLADFPNSWKNGNNNSV